MEEPSSQEGQPASPRVKRRKIHDVEYYSLLADPPTESGDESAVLDDEVARSRQDSPLDNNIMKVVRLAWVKDSLSAGKVLDYSQYLIYEARKAPNDTEHRSLEKLPLPSSEELLRRAQQVARSSSQMAAPRRFQHEDRAQHIKRPPLLPQSTTEEDALSRLPPIPEYLRTTYSCQRPTVVHPPNEAFIEKLKEVRKLRKMTGDEIGVRAYSSAIASLSAYPYKLQSAIGICSS